MYTNTESVTMDSNTITVPTCSAAQENEEAQKYVKKSRLLAKIAVYF